MSLKPVVEASDSSARRHLRAKLGTPDEDSYRKLLTAIAEEKHTAVSNNVRRLGWWDRFVRWVSPSVDNDSLAAHAGELDPVFRDRPLTLTAAIWHRAKWAVKSLYSYLVRVIMQLIQGRAGFTMSIHWEHVAVYAVRFLQWNFAKLKMLFMWLYAKMSRQAYSSYLWVIAQRNLPTRGTTMCYVPSVAESSVTRFWSPLFEELIKSSAWYVGVPRPSALLGLAEFIFRKDRTIYSVAPLTLHILIEPLSFFNRLCLHVAWNNLMVVGVKRNKYVHQTSIGPVTGASCKGYVFPYDEIKPLLEIDERIMPGLEYADRQPYLKVVDTNGETIPIDKVFAEFNDDPRDQLFLNGITFQFCQPTIQADCAANVVASLRNRLFQPRPRTVDNSEFVIVENYLLNLLPTCKSVISAEEWMHKYPGARKKILLNEIKSYLSSSEELPEIRTRPFLKKELNATNVEMGLYKAPRSIIGPAREITKAIQGPPVATIQRAVEERWDGTFRTYDVCGGLPIALYILTGRSNMTPMDHFSAWVMSLRDSAIYDFIAVAVCGDDSWMCVRSKGVDVFIESDASKWDANFMHEFISMENRLFASCLGYYEGENHSIYSDILGSYSDVKEFLAQRIKSEAFKFNITRKSEGLEIYGLAPPMRKSGSPETLIGNSIANAGVSLRVGYLVYSDLKILNAEEIKSSVITARIKQDVVARWSSFGFTVDANVWWDASMTSFCSCLLYPVGSALYAIPKVGRFLSRHPFSVDDFLTVQQFKAAVNQFKHLLNVPFIGDLLAAELRLLTEVGEDNSKLDKYSNTAGSQIVVPPPDESSWAWFQSYYGIEPQERGMLVAELDKVDCLPYVVSSASVRSIIKQDMEWY